MIKYTKKLYLENQYLSNCEAEVIDITEKGIVFDQTVAFPEGGGQEGDYGTISIQKGGKQIVVPFIDTQSGFGKYLNYLDDFPSIHVNTPIYHKLNNEEDYQHLEIGDHAVIMIDIERRAKHAVNHTGIHLALMGVEQLYPGIYKNIKGALINEEYGRLDFFKEKQFTQYEIEEINKYVNKLIAADKPINVFPHEKEPEAWYWECDGYVIPCGGSHLSSTGALGTAIIKRKTKGKTTERIISQYPNAELNIAKYH
jgi:alanyl-tRNA synthetase